MIRKDFVSFKKQQVFLNYPFDGEFLELADSMSFAVVAAGLIPVCAYEFTTPDLPRLAKLIEVITNCQYSAHDLSRSTGAGPKNLSRMNMPLEMGMAIFHAFDTQHKDHRCFFFIQKQNEYREFASNLAGLDPIEHNNDEEFIVAKLYEWLAGIVEPKALFNSKPISDIVDKYKDFKKLKKLLKGSGKNGSPSHDETRELMYVLNTVCGWWDIRDNRSGRNEFYSTPLVIVLNETKSFTIDHDTDPEKIRSIISEALSGC